MSVTALHPVDPRVPRVRGPRSPRSWLVIVALLGLSIVPLTAGTLRLIQLAGGPEILPADPRISFSPVPIVIHIVCAAVYALLGVLQFLPAFRGRHRAWHRRAGRVLAAAGLLVAGSAVWMTLAYARQPGTGDLLFFSRLVFGTALAAFLVLGITAVRRGDLIAHRAWMIRAYAIAIAAGTQVFTEGFSESIFGAGPLQDDLAKVSAWVINLLIAEWIIRGRRPIRSGRGRARPAGRPRRAQGAVAARAAS